MYRPGPHTIAAQHKISPGFAALWFAAAISVVGPAKAASLITATYTGAVRNSYDQGAEFGLTGNALNGMRFVAVYRYDPGLAAGAYRYTDASADVASGGTAYGPSVPTPIISATLTINGITRAFLSDYFGEAAVENAPYDPLTYHESDHTVFGPDAFGRTILDNYGYNPAAPVSLTQAFSGASGPISLYGDGYFSISTFDTALNAYTHSAHGDLVADHVTIGVPEPSSWLLAIGGLSMVGVSLRRRRTESAATA